MLFHSCNTYRSSHDPPIQVFLLSIPSQMSFLSLKSISINTVFHLLVCLLWMGTSRNYQVDTKSHLYKCQSAQDKAHRLSCRVIRCSLCNMCRYHSLHANGSELPTLILDKPLQGNVLICTERILGKCVQDSDPNSSQYSVCKTLTAF